MRRDPPDMSGRLDNMRANLLGYISLVLRDYRLLSVLPNNPRAASHQVNRYSASGSQADTSLVAHHERSMLHGRNLLHDFSQIYSSTLADRVEGAANWRNSSILTVFFFLNSKGY